MIIYFPSTHFYFYEIFKQPHRFVVDDFQQRNFMEFKGSNVVWNGEG